MYVCLISQLHNSIHSPFLRSLLTFGLPSMTPLLFFSFGFSFFFFYLSYLRRAWNRTSIRARLTISKLDFHSLVALSQFPVLYRQFIVRILVCGFEIKKNQLVGEYRDFVPTRNRRIQRRKRLRRQIFVSIFRLGKEGKGENVKEARVSEKKIDGIDEGNSF